MGLCPDLSFLVDELIETLESVSLPLHRRSKSSCRLVSCGCYGRNCLNEAFALAEESPGPA
jgi:hypothetical protein